MIFEPKIKAFIYILTVTYTALLS